MNIVEIFYSIQGEGLLAGVPAAFVRVAGCPLRCRWCDTKYAWDASAGSDYCVERILEEVEKFNGRYVVITGGEPMLQGQVAELSAGLKNAGKHVTIETAGVTFVPNLVCDLMSISPKLSNAAAVNPKAIDIDILRKLIGGYDYQLKFVVDSQDDLQEIESLLEKIGNIDVEKVLLMPQAQNREQFLDKSLLVSQMCKQTGYRFGQRIHILLYDGQPGT